MEFIDKYSRVDAISTDGDEVNYSELNLLMTKQMFKIRGHQTIVSQTLLGTCMTLCQTIAWLKCSTWSVLILVCSDSILFVSDYVEEIEYEFDKFEGFKNRTKKLNKT